MTAGTGAAPVTLRLTEIFFSLPSSESLSKIEHGDDKQAEKMDINAVTSLGVQGIEDSYVSCGMYRRFLSRPDVDLGRETVFDSPISRFCFVRQEIYAVHDTLIDNTKSREVECTSCYLRS